MSGNSVMKQVYYKVSSDKKLKKAFKNLHKRIMNFLVGNRRNSRGRCIFNMLPCLQGFKRTNKGLVRLTTFYVKIKGEYWEVVEHSRWNTMFETREEAVAYLKAVNRALDNRGLFYFNNIDIRLKEPMKLSELIARVEWLDNDINTMLESKYYDQRATNKGKIYHNPNRTQLMFDTSKLINMTLGVGGTKISKFMYLQGSRREYKQKVYSIISLNKYINNKKKRQATHFKDSVEKALHEWLDLYLTLGGSNGFADDYNLVVDYLMIKLSPTKLAILSQYEIHSIFDNKVKHSMLRQTALTVFGYVANNNKSSDMCNVQDFEKDMLVFMKFILEFVVPPTHRLFKTISKKYFSDIVLDSITYPYKEFDWRYK